MHSLRVHNNDEDTSTSNERDEELNIKISKEKVTLDSQKSRNYTKTEK